MATLSDEVRSILDKKTFAHVATLMPDGSPQVSPVWVDYDGDLVIFNTAKGRQKSNNLERDPRIAISATDPENPYQPVLIRGKVVEITESGAEEHTDKLAKKYLDEDKYPFGQPGEERVIVKVEPESISVGQ